MGRVIHQLDLSRSAGMMIMLNDSAGSSPAITTRGSTLKSASSSVICMCKNDDPNQSGLEVRAFYQYANRLTPVAAG